MAVFFWKIVSLFKKEKTIRYLNLHIHTTTNGGWAQRMWINTQLEHYKV